MHATRAQREEEEGREEERFRSRHPFHAARRDKTTDYPRKTRVSLLSLSPSVLSLPCSLHSIISNLLGNYVFEDRFFVQNCEESRVRRSKKFTRSTVDEISTRKLDLPDLI